MGKLTKAKPLSTKPLSQRLRAMIAVHYRSATHLVVGDVVVCAEQEVD